MTDKRRVMSEAFMMKSYYYPSDDSPNSINGTFVIDFKNYSLDKKQKSQSGGAPDISRCSRPQTGNKTDAPLQTMAAIYDVSRLFFAPSRLRVRPLPPGILQHSFSLLLCSFARDSYSREGAKPRSSEARKTIHALSLLIFA
jgi:hypothetical protein